MAKATDEALSIIIKNTAVPVGATVFFGARGGT